MVYMLNNREIYLKGIITEDFVNYKKISMTLEFPTCSFKCDKECGQSLCQNWPLAQQTTYHYKEADIINLYFNNPITEAIVCQGLEPLDSFDQLCFFISDFRESSNDDIVVYTGYKESEKPAIRFKDFILNNNIKHIIVKYGRYIPNQQKHYDSILGVDLASDNQYAIKIA